MSRRGVDILTNSCKMSYRRQARGCDMDKVVVHFHKESDSMDIWFGNPEDEADCEEAGEGIILKKDRRGKVIGIEKLHVSKTVGASIPFPVELIVA